MTPPIRPSTTAGASVASLPQSHEDEVLREQAPGRDAMRLARTRVTEDDFPPALLLLAFSAVALCMPPHNDTWWHLRSGLEMVRHGGLVLTERLSHTAQGSPLFHNHEWLTQLLFYTLYSTGGPVLLAAACAASVLAGIVAAWRLVVGSPEARFGFLVVLLVGTTMGWAIRPQAISLPLFVLALYLATSDRDRWLPVLCLVWANLHAVAVTGVVIAGCAALDAMLMAPARTRRSLLVLAACVAAPVATPLGVWYWPRVLEVVRLARQLGINEYRSAFEWAMLPFWIALTGFAWLLAFGGRDWMGSRRTRVLVLVALVFAVASILSVRNVPLFVLAGVPAMSRLLPLQSERRPARALSPAGLATLTLVAVAAAAGVVYVWRDGGIHLGWRPIAAPAVAAIRNCEGRLFNGFADGGALTWFVPERQVFVDSRGVEAYPLALLRRSREADLHGRYQELFADTQIRCAFVQNGSVMANTLSSDGSMRTIYADRQWRVFRRVP